MKQILVSELAKNSFSQKVIFFTEEGKMVVQNASPFFSHGDFLDKAFLEVQIAHYDAELCVVHGNVLLSEEELLVQGFQLLHPRDYFLKMGDQAEIEKKVLRAAHWSVAHRMQRHCRYCGGSLQKLPETTEKKCPQCHHSFFPKLSPAVLALIQRGDEILLARGTQHSPGMYTVLAGFIDLGESAEETVHREVKEEVGLEVTNLKYFGSQSWPFPDSFMIAFQADYLRGEIKIDPNELEEARWFHRDEMPLLPPPSTLSRKLIDNFVREKKRPEQLQGDKEQAILWNQKLGKY